MFEKKLSYQNSPKYGIISFLPRNLTPISIVIVDSKTEEMPIGRDDIILQLLKYYAKQYF